MILSASMRTDIPAFYSKWFMNRVREGYVYVRNPYYRNKVTKYIISPKVIDLLCFGTKNPHPMLDYIDEIKQNYKMIWYITITPYGKDIEPNVPDKKQVIEDVKTLSNKLGYESIMIRYDPICMNEKFNVSKHIYAFEKLVKQLKGYIHNITISFLDIYEKVKKNAPDLRAPTKEEEIELAKAFTKIGKENGMMVHGCCEDRELGEYGLDMAGCMSKSIVERVCGYRLNPPKSSNMRGACNCLMGHDIGAYNSCMHLCRYCYANYNQKVVMENVKKHDPNSPFLIGSFMEGDILSEAKQKSWKASNMEQLSFLEIE